MMKGNPPSPTLDMPRPRDATAGNGSLDALRAAVHANTGDGLSRQRERIGRPSLLVSALAGAIAAGAVFLWQDLLYRVVIDVRCAANGGVLSAETYGGWWRDFVNGEAIGIVSGTDPRQWQSKVESVSVLRLEASLPREVIDAGAVPKVVEQFFSWTDLRRRKAAELPSEGERTLTDLVRELKGRLSDATSEARGAATAELDADPRDVQRELIRNWSERLAAFDVRRQELLSRTAALGELRGRAPPMEAAVPAEKREAALSGHLALQQDLRELEVRLAETRAQLSAVWQASSTPLEELLRLTDEYVGLCGQVASDGDAKVEPNSKAFSATSGQYRDLLLAFSENWKREFVVLKQMTVDPLRADLLDLYGRLRILVSDFLYQGAGRLAEMREQIHALSSDGRDTARHHVQQSNLLRGFQALQAGHHRFEFAAGGLDTQGNFQLDSALQGARGLRRRSQQEIRMIDERLAKEAIANAKKEHATSVEQMEKSLVEMRRALDVEIAALLKSQNELNLQSGLTEEFFRALVKAESAETRVAATQDHLSVAAERLTQLTTKRLAGANAPRPEFTAVESGERPINLRPVLKTTGLTAAVAILAAHVIQWLTLRRIGQLRKVIR